ncbi:MAG: hypothetical protein WCI43_04345 [Candidatus Firestonebacteria bacterium]
MFKPKYKIKKLFKTENERREYYLKVYIERKESAGAFVREGFLYCKQLAVSGASKPIQAGESAITALCVSVSGVVWGATSGKKSHLFYYMPKSPCGQVFDMGQLGPEAGETKATAITVTDDNTVVVGTAAGNIYEVSGRGTVTEGVQEWMAHYVKRTKAHSPFKKESIAALCYAKSTKRIFGLTRRSGSVFEYIPGKMKVRILVKLGKGNYSPVMACDDYGQLYFVSKGGILRYNSENRRLDSLTLPDKKLKEVTALALKSAGSEINSVGAALYLGNKAGELFEYLMNSLKATPVGKPCKMKNISLLAAGKNGKIYGVAGEENDLSHLFTFDPVLKKTRDLGVPLASIEKPWYGYNFGAIAAGPEGELYLGEADRISHIFIYHPPV